MAPFRRASDSPIAIACFRLVTRFPERPLRKVPRFRRRIALSTVFWAFLPYRAIVSSLRPPQRSLPGRTSVYSHSPSRSMP